MNERSPGLYWVRVKRRRDKTGGAWTPAEFDGQWLAAFECDFWITEDEHKKNHPDDPWVCEVGPPLAVPPP